jgi:hypothetical protein
LHYIINAKSKNKGETTVKKIISAATTLSLSPVIAFAHDTGVAHASHENWDFNPTQIIASVIALITVVVLLIIAKKILYKEM